jgi:hypothetical protein
VASKSFASLRFRPIQAKIRSTTQRRELTAKPIWSGSLRTISTAINVAVVTFFPAYPQSAKTRWTNGRMRRETQKRSAQRGWLITAELTRAPLPAPLDDRGTGAEIENPERCSRSGFLSPTARGVLGG